MCQAHVWFGGRDGQQECHCCQSLAARALMVAGGQETVEGIPGKGVAHNGVWSWGGEEASARVRSAVAGGAGTGEVGKPCEALSRGRTQGNLRCRVQAGLVPRQSWRSLCRGARKSPCSQATGTTACSGHTAAPPCLGARDPGWGPAQQGHPSPGGQGPDEMFAVLGTLPIWPPNQCPAQPLGNLTSGAPGSPVLCFWAGLGPALAQQL